MIPMKSFEPTWLALSDTLTGGDVSRRSKETYLSKSSRDTVLFNTVLLPKLGKEVYRSFETGTLSPVEEFKFRNGIPVFLKELFSRVYANGNLREHLSPNQICSIRKILQLLMVFYKYEDTDTVDNSAELVANFKRLQVSREKFLDGELSLSQLTLLSKARVLVHKVLGNFDPCDIKPFHGSGVVRTQEKNWEKWGHKPYYPNLEKLYPAEEYNCASYSHLCDELGLYFERQVSSGISVRITTVPKNSSTRRMIAVEECYPQYIKMGIMDKLYDIIEQHPLTKGFVNFSSQEHNRDMALHGSKDRSFATIDMKAASDSVYVGIVQRLFPRGWSEALLRSRATTAIYNGEEFPIYTFATMGSATCFPVEALVFWSIVSACVGHTQNFVYGDDIIVHNDDFQSVIEALESLGFAANHSKSYARGFFRESCGGDYLHGTNVSVVKLRHDPSEPDSSTVQFLNNIRTQYGEKAALAIHSSFCCYYEYFIPFSTDIRYANSCLIVESERAANDVFLRRRWNSALQRYEYRVKLLSPTLKRAGETWFEVLRSLNGKAHKSSHCAYDDALHLIHRWSWVDLYPGKFKSL